VGLLHSFYRFGTWQRNQILRARKKATYAAFYSKLQLVLCGRCFRRTAGFVESLDECFGDHRRMTAFEVATFEHLNELAALDKTDLRRRRNVPR